MEDQDQLVERSRTPSTPSYRSVFPKMGGTPTGGDGKIWMGGEAKGAKRGVVGGDIVALEQLKSNFLFFYKI